MEDIVRAWKTKLEADLGGNVELTEDDIEAIYLVPYKISRDNGTTEYSLPKHIDCEVRVITKDFFLAEFLVEMPDGTRVPVEDERINYREGDSVKKTELAPTEGENSKFPQTKEYNGVTYEFVGWYNEADNLIDENEWPYKPNSEELQNNIVTFTAKYVPKTYNLTITKTLSGNMYNANDTFEFTVNYTNGEEKTFTLGDDDMSNPISIPNGATVTITETNAEGYDFSVASITEGVQYDPDKNSVTFTMPANDVSIVIDNKKDVDIDTGVFLDTLPYILILGVAAAGAVVLVKRRKHSDD